MAHACSPSTRKAKVGSGVQGLLFYMGSLRGQSGLYNSLSHNKSSCIGFWNGKV